MKMAQSLHRSSLVISLAMLAATSTIEAFGTQATEEDIDDEPLQALTTTGDADDQADPMIKRRKRRKVTDDINAIVAKSSVATEMKRRHTTTDTGVESATDPTGGITLAAARAGAYRKTNGARPEAIFH